jgi:hypothetical protein
MVKKLGIYNLRDKKVGIYNDADSTFSENDPDQTAAPAWK